MTNYCPVEEELSAYTTDLSRLFTDFDSAKTLRFEDFSKRWRKLNFSYVHCGKKSAGDRYQGTERLLRCISGFFTPETQDIYRIAAIYAAYSVYYTQICRPKVKIRMTIAMWDDLKQLQTQARELQHNDVDYVITKLENDKAFVFTAMPKQLEYGNKELMTNMESSGSEVITFRKYYMPEQYIQDSIRSSDFLKRTASIENEYRSVKSDICNEVNGKFDEKTVSRLNLIKNSHSGLQHEFSNFEKWLKVNTHSQDVLNTSQRPVPKKLAEKEGSNLDILQCDTPQEDRSKQMRAERIQALKLQSFRQPIPVCPDATYVVVCFLHVILPCFCSSLVH